MNRSVVYSFLLVSMVLAIAVGGEKPVDDVIRTSTVVVGFTFVVHAFFQFRLVSPLRRGMLAFLRSAAIVISCYGLGRWQYLPNISPGTGSLEHEVWLASYSNVGLRILGIGLCVVLFTTFAMRQDQRDPHEKSSGADR